MNNFRLALAIVLGVALVSACQTTPAPVPSPQDLALLREQVIVTERGFARTMADRDFGAFQSYVAEEAIFFSGKTPIRGKAAVAADWKRFYEGREAPFRWEPAQVEVLDSGALALSSGPVFDPAGTEVATFTSVWRRESPGVWRIVFDKGNAACNCAKR